MFSGSGLKLKQFFKRTRFNYPHLGAVAQLGERLLCKQEVIGSIPFSSTSFNKLVTFIGFNKIVDGVILYISGSCPYIP